ncbi:MAG: hypothetical protein E7063_06495 [Spirochaetaceae bacterium]|nr:hypothetical protein [Spirochaetaceae bacterium]
MRRSLYVTVILFSLLLTSCSDSVPSITEVSSSVVLDFYSSQDFPSNRLSIFVKTSSEIGRVSHIQVKHIESGIVWDINDPMILTGGSNNYRAGSPFLVPPYYGNIPQGAYSLLYTDMSGRTVEYGFSVYYESELLELKVQEIPDAVKHLPVVKKIAIYEQPGGKGKIIYYGDIKDDWKDSSKILNDYNGASSVRECLEISSKAVLCLFPPKDIK